jgi:hypothetical protein
LRCGSYAAGPILRRHRMPRAKSSHPLRGCIWPYARAGCGG